MATGADVFKAMIQVNALDNVLNDLAEACFKMKHSTIDADVMRYYETAALDLHDLRGKLLLQMRKENK